MAAQTSASSSRASAKQAQRRAKRSESLSGSMRQFLTPEVWKQVKHAASQHGCRNGVRWTLQPLIMIAAIMTWCAGETDADRFVLSRSFYVQVHCPKRQRPGKALSGFCKALLRLPMPVWWAFCDAVRSRVFHLLADRMTMEGWLPLGCDGSRMECPRTAELEQSLGKSSKDKSAPTLWVIALVSLTTGVLPWHRRNSYEPDAPARGVPQSPRWRVGLVCARMRNFLAGVILWSWRLGTSKTGERRYLIDLLETLPQAVLQSVLLVCVAGYVGYDLFGHLLKQQCSFLIRLSPHELPRLARSVGRPRGGCFWLESWTTPTIPTSPQYREPMPEDLVSQRCA